jgi:hypothetical protein
MKLKRFEELLDRRGADLAAWAPEDAAAARALMAISPEARRQFALAETVDAALHATGASRASAELQQRVLAMAYAQPQEAMPQRQGVTGWMRAWSGEWRGWTAGLATATAAMLLGFVLGISGAVPFQTRSSDQMAQLTGYGADLDEGTEMAAVMLGDRSGELEQ